MVKNVGMIVRSTPVFGYGREKALTTVRPEMAGKTVVKQNVKETERHFLCVRLARKNPSSDVRRFFENVYQALKALIGVMGHVMVTYVCHIINVVFTVKRISGVTQIFTKIGVTAVRHGPSVVNIGEDIVMLAMSPMNLTSNGVNLTYHITCLKFFTFRFTI